MKLVKLSATALTISIVATVLIKADQFLSRDSLGQKTKDPVRIQSSELIDKDTIISEEAEKPTNESLLVEKIEKLTARINELEAELINQQAEEEAISLWKVLMLDAIGIPAAGKDLRTEIRQTRRLFEDPPTTRQAYSL